MGRFLYVSLGTLLTSSGPVGISDNGIQICIVDGPNALFHTLLQNKVFYHQPTISQSDGS